jgi:hypothetical protein
LFLLSCCFWFSFPFVWSFLWSFFLYKHSLILLQFYLVGVDWPSSEVTMSQYILPLTSDHELCALNF